MYPTLSYFIKEVTGMDIPLPIQTYGLMVGMALITGGFIYSLEYKRKEKDGLLIPFYLIKKYGEAATKTQLITTFIFSFLLGFKLIYAIENYSAFTENAQEYILSKDGNFIGGIVFAVIATFYFWWKKNKEHKKGVKIELEKTLPHQIAANMLLFVGVWGLIGAKLFDVIQPANFKSFLADPISSLLSFSGLTFYGGVIVGFASGIYYVRKYNINVIHSIDAFAPSISIAYAIGRMGCHVSGDGCWGVINTKPKPGILPEWAWSYDYPHNVINQGNPINGIAEKFNYVLPDGVFPTSLYESTIMIFVFLILWTFRKKIKIPGILFSMYLIFAGFERYFIETIRVTKHYNFLGLSLSQAQIISILMITGGATIIFLILKNKQKIIELGKPKMKDINKEAVMKKKVEAMKQQLPVK